MITIELGDGTHNICSLVAEDNSYAGIGFKKLKSSIGVGQYEKHNPPISEEGCYLRIITDNMDSINVLINQLQEARANFMEANDA